MSKAGSLLQRIRNREFRYVFKRIFPKDNFVFFAGRQLIFGMGSMEKARARFEHVTSRLDYDVRPATGVHKRDLLDAFPEQADGFNRCFDRGATCYLALSGREIVAYIWVQPRAPVYETKSLWSFTPDPPGGYWYFDAFVQPKYRGSGAFFYLAATVAQHYQPEPGPVYGETSYNNHESVKAHTAMGYRRIRTVDFVTILGLRLYSVYNHDNGKRTFSTRFALNPKTIRL